MNNGNYIQFYVDDAEAIASDGMQPIDARLVVIKLCDIAFAKLSQEYFRAKGYNGFDIFKNKRKIYSIRKVIK